MLRCRRRGLKVNAGKSRVMVLNGEEGLEYKVHIDWIHLEHASEFKFLCFFWTNQVQMEQNAVARGPAGGGLQVPLGLKLMLGVCSMCANLA